MATLLSEDPNAGQLLSDDPNAGMETKALAGGSEAKIGPGTPESIWEKAKEAFHQAIFGSEDRPAAKAAGIGLTPTPAELADAAAHGAGAALAGASMGSVTPTGLALGLGGSVLGKQAGELVGSVPEAFGVPNARKVGGQIGAVVGGIAGPMKGEAGLAAGLRMFPNSRVAAIAKYALGDAAETAVAAAADPLVTAAESLAKQKTFKDAPTALAFLKSMSPEQQASALKQLLPGGSVGEVLPFVPKVAQAVAPVAAEAAPLTATIAERIAPAAAKAVPDVVAKHASLVQFAKQIAAQNPKAGEKIWMELGEDGLPTRYLTPDQAGAAARAGKSTTWVRNMWSH